MMKSLALLGHNSLKLISLTSRTPKSLRLFPVTQMQAFIKIAFPLKVTQIINLQHFGESPLPTYEPVFDWENERSLIFGQRIPEAHMSQYTRF